MTKTLIAYFSRADENYFGGAMRYVKVGNTEIVCGLMKELIDADSFKIEMKEPYSPVYMTCIEEAKKDLRAKARPELVAMPESIDEYDTIILAYPNYWGTMPIRTTGAPCRWRCSPSWRRLISAERPSCPCAPTRAAAWAAAKEISSASAPVRQSRAGFPLLAAQPQTQRKP